MELVERARHGDREAFGVLAAGAVDRLYGIARLILRDTELAEDATQEALVRAWRDLPTLRDVERFDAWLYRLIVRASADIGRHRRRWRAEITVLPKEPSESDHTSALADRDLLERGLRRLTDGQQAILILHLLYRPDAKRDGRRTRHSRRDCQVSTPLRHRCASGRPRGRRAILARRRAGGPVGMTANESLERQVADYYASEAPHRAPDWVLRSALETIEHTQQRRVFIRAPRRFPRMNSFAKVAIAAVVVIAVGAVGLSVLGPRSPSDVGALPTASPSPSPSPTPSSSPSASQITPPALTETFTSERHGFSISYPTGWADRRAADPWTTAFPSWGSTDGDLLYDPAREDHLFLMVASQPLSGKTGAQWVDDLLAGLASADECDAPIQPVMIDGTQGQLCASGATAVSAGDRGYAIMLYVSPDDPAVQAAYDQEFFTAILATLQLTPETAVDTASSPSPSASP
jgi:RNA polymerase sigma-70 factor (ECF subfamily)